MKKDEVTALLTKLARPETLTFLQDMATQCAGNPTEAQIETSRVELRRFITELEKVHLHIQYAATEKRLAGEDGIPQTLQQYATKLHQFLTEKEPLLGHYTWYATLKEDLESIMEGSIYSIPAEHTNLINSIAGNRNFLNDPQHHHQIRVNRGQITETSYALKILHAHAEKLVGPKTR